MNRQWVRLIAGLVTIAALVTIAGLVLLATSSSRFAPNSYTASRQNVGAPGSSNVDPDAKGSLAAPGPTPVPGTGGTATTSGSGFANGAGQLLSVPPRLPHSGEQGIENEHEVDPVTPIDLNPVIKTTAPTAPEVNPPKQASTLTGTRSADGPNTPDAAFYFFKTTDLGGGASLIGEASQASDGLLALETWNWGAALSHDGGKSWGYLNPYTLFPASYGGFCCDQVIYYDQTHDITFWILQYSPNVSGTNVIRVAWANGANKLSTAAFCYTDFRPDQIGSPIGTNYDQPKFARSDNDIYLEMTQYGAAGGSIVIRVAASAFTPACSGVGYNWYVPGLFSPGFTQRGYSDMYFAAHVSNSTLRVFDWPESAGISGITTHDVSHTAYPVNLPNQCPRTGGTATSDWCQRRSFGGGWAHSDRIFTGWQAGGVVTFLWDATQGNNGVGGFTFAYPYTHIVRINQSTFALINEPIQWSSGFAIQYATAALDDRLHVAGTVLWGGGNYYESSAVWIADDLSPGYTGVGFFPSGVWEWYSGPMSNIDPTDTLSGDYLSTRRNSWDPYTWGGSTYSLLNNGAGAVSVHPYYLWFGRGRDTPVIDQLFLPLVGR